MRLVPQTSIYEVEIENADLEALLEEREHLKDGARQARKLYREADKQAKAMADGLDLGDEASVRVGRFVITRRRIAARSVAFETEPTTRLTIKAVEES